MSVVIAPARLSEDSYAKLQQRYNGGTDMLNLWADLKLEYNNFEKNRTLSRIGFLPNGRHKVE